jgi:hypothetical protein
MGLLCWLMGLAGKVRFYGIIMVTSMREPAVFLPSIADPEHAELLACRLAINLARDAGVTRLIMETDCMGVVSKLRSTEMDRSVHGPLVEDIKVLLQDFGEFKIQHARRRSADEVANRFAKEGCKNKVCNSWMGVPPDFFLT